MKIVVIGNGMVGYKFCEKLVSKAGSSAFDITVFGEEVRPAYDRVHLSEYFAGKSADDLTLATHDWYEQNNIRLYLGDPIQRAATTEQPRQGSFRRALRRGRRLPATGGAGLLFGHYRLLRLRPPRRRRGARRA